MSGTKSALSTLKLLYLNAFNDRICPVDECDYILPENTLLCTHFMHTHINLPADYTPDLLTNLILSIGDYPDQFHELTVSLTPLRVTFLSKPSTMNCFAERAVMMQYTNCVVTL